jgi:hypothetical protein
MKLFNCLPKCLKIAVGMISYQQTQNSRRKMFENHSLVVLHNTLKFETKIIFSSFEYFDEAMPILESSVDSIEKMISSKEGQSGVVAIVGGAKVSRTGGMLMRSKTSKSRIILID